MKKLLYFAATMVIAMLSLVSCNKTENQTDIEDPLPNLENVKTTLSKENNSLVISQGEYVKTTITPVFNNGVCTSYTVVQVWAKESWAKQIMEKAPQDYSGATLKGNTITVTYNHDIYDLGLIGLKQADYMNTIEELIKTNGQNNGENNGENNTDSTSYLAPATMNFGGQFLSSVQGIRDDRGVRQDSYDISFGTEFSQTADKTFLDYIVMNYGYEYTVRSTNPLIFKSDATTYPFEKSFTDQFSLSLNTSGYITAFSRNDNQEVGKITYNDKGMIESLEWKSMYNNDYSNQEINAIYHFSNDGETLYGITGQINQKDDYDGEEENRSFGIDIRFNYSGESITNTTRQQTPFTAKTIGGYLDTYDDIVSGTASRFALLGYFGKGSDKLPSGISIKKIWQYEEGVWEENTELNVEYTIRENGALDTVITYESSQEEEEEEERYIESAYEFSYYGDAE